MVYNQVPHKQGCTTTEDGLRGEISDLEDIELSMYIHKKTTEVDVAPAYSVQCRSSKTGPWCMHEEYVKD